MLQSLGHMPEISMTSVIDILFVALVIYGFLKLLKWTHAMPALLGVALVRLAVYWAHFEDLKTIDWLVAAVAAAQHLRADRGVCCRNPPLAGVAWGEAFPCRAWAGAWVETYDDIVMAATLFAKNKTGALIIIERQDGLGNYIDSGVPLDANLSYDLLATIFLHKTRRCMMARSSCRRTDRCGRMFPAAGDRSATLDAMGTRHRAGIGITEETDAIAVIVSEETGSISVASGGGIERDLTPEHLRERISELLRRYIPRTTLPTVGNRTRTGHRRSQSRVSSAAKNTWLKGRNCDHARILPPLRAQRPGPEGPGAADLHRLVVGGRPRSRGGVRS